MSCTGAAASSRPRSPQFFILTATFVFILICQSTAQPYYFVSNELGSDGSPNCDACRPCKTIGRALNFTTPQNPVDVVLYGASTYELGSQALPAAVPQNTTIRIRGIQWDPKCNFTIPTAAPKLIGGFRSTFNVTGVSVRFMNLKWDPPSGEAAVTLQDFARLRFYNVAFNCSTLCEIKLYMLDYSSTVASFEHIIAGPSKFRLNFWQADDEREPLPRMNVTVASSVFIGTLEIIGREEADLKTSDVDFGVLNCTFDGGLVYKQFDLSTLKMHANVFKSGVAQLRPYAEQYAQAVLSVTNNTFLFGSGLVLPDSMVINTTMRYNVFENPPNITDNYVRPNVLAGFNLGHIDARANWWGSASGAYSCCNYKSDGVYAVDADTSSWCLDPKCSAISAPLAAVWVPHVQQFCELETLCGTDITLSLAIVGTLVAVGVLACFAVAALFFFRDRHERRRLANSELATLSLSPPSSRFHPEGKSLHIIFLFVSINIDLCIAIAAWTPTAFTTPARKTVDTVEIMPWAVLCSSVMSAVSLVRICSHIWSLVVLRNGHPYKSLFASTIFSALTTLVAIMWRMSAMINGYHATEASGGGATFFFVYHGSELTTHTVFFWVLWAYQATTQVFLSVPIVAMGLRIITTRDYTEVEMLRKAIANLPGLPPGTFMRTGRLDQKATYLGYGCVVYGILLVLLWVVLSSTGERYLGAAPVYMISVVLVVCASIAGQGFVTLRWFFYDIARGWVFFSLMLGLAFNWLELSSYYLFTFFNTDSVGFRSKYGVIGGIGSVALAISLVIAFLTFKLLRTMKTELAPSVAAAVYERLEEAFG